jgi:hypothetical protein
MFLTGDEVIRVAKKMFNNMFAKFLALTREELPKQFNIPK